MEEKPARPALYPAVPQARFRDPHDHAKWGRDPLAVEKKEVWKAVKDLRRVTGWGWGAGWDPGHWYRCCITGSVNGPGSRTGEGQLPPDLRAAQVSRSSQGRRQTAPTGSPRCLQDKETTDAAQMPGPLSEPPSPTSRAPDMPRTG